MERAVEPLEEFKVGFVWSTLTEELKEEGVATEVKVEGAGKVKVELTWKGFKVVAAEELKNEERVEVIVFVEVIVRGSSLVKGVEVIIGVELEEAVEARVEVK